jgi:subtilisin family serine protease
MRDRFSPCSFYAEPGRRGILEHAKSTLNNPKTDIIMKPKCISFVILNLALGFFGPGFFPAQSAQKTEMPPDFSKGISYDTRGAGPASKLSGELRDLATQVTATRGDRFATRYTPMQLQKQFGIAQGEKRPEVEVAIRTTDGASTNELNEAGAQIWCQAGGMIFARVPVSRLERVALVPTVKSILSLSAVETPPLPKVGAGSEIMDAPRGRGSEKLADKFDRQELTGKGVIVGVIDTGIDWRHGDFIGPDGNTRILYLYDPFDDSWQTSGGQIGSKPPYTRDGKPFGTLYTSQQINAALAGNATLSSRDAHGHGTACAGVAAGNGRATGNGVPGGIYQGVASEADLIIVKRCSDDEKDSLATVTAMKWILAAASSLQKPCVISMSFGGHYSSHDGSDPSEVAIDNLVGAGKPGIAAVIAGGNEAQHNLHAGGRFGPPDQPDNYSAPIELFVGAFTQLNAFFTSADDWGLTLHGLDNFLVNEEGEPVGVYFYHSATQLHGVAWQKGAKYTGSLVKDWKVDPKITSPSDFSEYAGSYVRFQTLQNGLNKVTLSLPPGKYLVQGYGKGTNVTDGRFDLYLPASYEASFGRGVTATALICTPGNSANAITVGSYAFRNQWENLKGTTTTYTLPLGKVSEYSSPGFRRDEVVKPEITAPAEYAISSLAKDCQMGKTAAGEPNAVMTTRDGFHLAWCGTSAATPYVAGVIALMLQKNPGLDAAQIKRILIETADRDNFTGAVPNREWGYGKINPVPALKRTPAKGS